MAEILQPGSHNQWNTDGVHLIRSIGKLIGLWGNSFKIWPCAKNNPRVHFAVHPGGNWGQRLVPHIQWVPFGAKNHMPGLLTQSVPGYMTESDEFIWFTVIVGLHKDFDKNPEGLVLSGYNLVWLFCFQEMGAVFINCPFSGVIHTYWSRIWCICWAVCCVVLVPL